MGAAAPSRPTRASRGQVRAWAWILGGVSVLMPWAMFGVSPKPAAGATAQPARPSRAQKQKRPVVVIVTKKIIYDPSISTPTYTSTSTSGGGITYVTAPAPSVPTVVSCGTHPC